MKVPANRLKMGQEGMLTTSNINYGSNINIDTMLEKRDLPDRSLESLSFLYYIFYCCFLALLDMIRYIKAIQYLQIVELYI